MSLASVFPRPVRITLAGRPFLAMELRVRELAELHAWRDEADPPPALRLGPPSAYPDHEAYRDHAKAIYEEAEEAADVEETGGTAPPRQAPSTIDPLQAEAMLLWMGLRGLNPGFTAEDAIGLALELRAGADAVHEWGRFREVILAVSPFERIARVVDPEWGSWAAGGGVPWPQAIEETRDATGLTYEEMGNLYLSQFDSLRSGGKSRGFPRPEPPEGVDLMEFARKQRAKWYGTPQSESPPPPKGEAATHEPKVPSPAPEVSDHPVDPDKLIPGGGAAEDS